ncbi:hypothetical protein IWX90DRAFT_230945 [Phyllosticta citrichinensis]|uniref:Peptidase S54 rhomboid domain-containing protein n=1 Tax=Phyllosticta citrichinensis TaxID=1130410 RepID=A0ABR1XUM4_9PEZI
MSNAWSIACRPFAGLRFHLSTPPPCVIARSIATCSSSTTRSALRLPRLQSHDHFAPPLLRYVSCHQFSTTPSVAKKSPKAKSSAPAVNQAHAKSEPEQAQQNEKQEDTPLPGGDLSAGKFVEIFGPGVSAAQGNAILRALQHRRVTGSLVEKGVQFDDFPHERALKGLEYLRATYPVDEQAAAAEYAEAEAERLESELVEKAQDMGLYKKDPIYGYSELDALRAKNEAIYEEQQKQKRLEEEKKEQVDIAAGKTKGRALEKPKAKFELRRPPKKPESEFTKHYREQATLSHGAPPEMSFIRRVGPSVLVCLAVVVLSYIFATTYSAPSRTARIWPDTPPALSTNLFLLSINLVAFLAWKIPPCWRFMNKYMIVVPGAPRALSVIGGIFSHSAPLHLLTNMLFLMIFGPYLHDVVGRANFLAIYLSGGAVGATASLLRHALQRKWHTSSLGASGALNAVVAAYFLLADAERRRVPFTDYEVPLQGHAILALLLFFELWSMRRAQNRDHVAHLGGMATGALAAVLLKRRVERERAEEGEKAQGAAAVARAHHRPGDLMVDWDAIKAKVPYWMGGTKR